MRIDLDDFIENMSFFNNTERNLSFDQVIERIIKFVERDKRGRYRLAIGTDSQVKSESTVFITAIIIHQIGKGAWGCVNKCVIPTRLMNLREKISLEAIMTQQIASMFTSDFFERIMEIILPYINKGANFEHEIHIDIGNKGETKKLIKEMVGFFTGLGFETKIKPESYAASSYANKYTK